MPIVYNELIYNKIKKLGDDFAIYNTTFTECYDCIYVNFP